MNKLADISFFENLQSGGLNTFPETSPFDDALVTNTVLIDNINLKDLGASLKNKCASAMRAIRAVEKEAGNLRKSISSNATRVKSDTVKSMRNGIQTGIAKTYTEALNDVISSVKTLVRVNKHQLELATGKINGRIALEKRDSKKVVDATIHALSNLAGFIGKNGVLVAQILAEAASPDANPITDKEQMIIKTLGNIIEQIKF